MRKKSSKNNYNWLVGLIFISPILYSTRLLEMDNLQKLLLFILALPSFIYLNRQKSENNVISFKFIGLILILLFPFTFLTSFFNDSYQFYLLELTYLLPPVFIVFFTRFTFNKVGEEKLFKVVSISVVLVSTFFSLIGLFQVMNIETIPLPQIIIPGSTIGHRGFAAEYLLPAIPFLLILKKYIKKDYYPLLLLSAIINLSFLFFTRSRSAFGISVLILVSVVLYILINKNIKNKYSLILPILSVYLISFLLSLIPPIKGERSDFSSNITSVVDTENRSNQMRMNFWNASLSMIKSNPVIGVGLQKWSGNYPQYYGYDFVDSQIYFVHAIHAHNDFLELFAENGFAAPIVYLVLILLILYNLFIKGKMNENYFFILLSAFSTVCFSLIAFPISKFSSYFFLAFAGGLAIIPRQKESRVINISSNQLKYLLTLLFIAGITTSYIRLSSGLSYVKAMEFKNGNDFSNMFKELEKVNPLLYPFDPSKQPIDFYRATALYRLGNLDEALLHSKKSEKIAPYNPLVLHNTAAIYQSSKKFDNAIFYYEKMRKLFPNYIDPQINLLLIYSENEQFEKGKRLFNELIKKDSINKRLISFKSKYSDVFN